MSGEQFQQWSQSSPLLSLDRFHLKQTPVLNFNCRDSLGFLSYFAQKTFFSVRFAFFQVLRHLIFRCPSGLLCVFKMFASFFWNFGWRALGPDWEFFGIPPFFWGSLFFLGLWEHPRFRGSLFFGTTLE